MVQKGSYIHIIDNSGAKHVCCIHVQGGYRKRYASLGEIIICSVKTMRKKRKLASKIKKGDIVRVLLVRTNSGHLSRYYGMIKYFENSGIIINPQNKLIGTRLFGTVPRSFRYTRHLRVVSIASGVNN